MPVSVSTASSTAAAAPLPAGLGTGRAVRRRLIAHHLPLAVASTLGLLVLIALSPSHGGFTVRQLAAPTGDVALVLLGLTLLVGPANLLLQRQNPVNSYLRRDIGTWTAIFSLVHVIIGFQGHSDRVFGFVDYFVADGRPRFDSFGLGNWTGLAATVVVVVLLAISTDRSLRQLKARGWKRLQRLNYALFALVVIHAIYYGALRRTGSAFTYVLLGPVNAVLISQWVGISLWRRRHPRSGAVPAALSS
jgi:methionine sulfoxide reductase heme-binding subunit